jgi:quinol monooxygenase YgiN
MIEIKIIAEFVVKEDQAEAFKSMLADAIVETRAFEGCKGVDIFEVVEITRTEPLE